MISGKTTLIAHIGYPTEPFKASLTYNPWFDAHGIDVAVVPMGVRGEHYPSALKAICSMTNVCGALITMPHKVSSIALADEVTTTARIAGSANTLLKRPDGTLLADMFDGAGFTRGVARKGVRMTGARCLVVGAGGVGSAIAASLAAEGVAGLALCDTNSASADALGARLRHHYPEIDVAIRGNDPAGYDIVVNATPLGMSPGDPLPIVVDRLSPSTFVGEVVMKQEITPLLAAARSIGCRYSVGTDMLFEMIPACLEFFGFSGATPEELRSLSRVVY